MLENALHLLKERDDDDERGRGKGPHPADDRPCVESGKVEHVNAEHGAGPDADEQRGEKDASDVRGDLGGSELSDDDVERRSVVEVLPLFEIQLTLFSKGKNEGKPRDNLDSIQMCRFKFKQPAIMNQFIVSLNTIYF